MDEQIISENEPSLEERLIDGPDKTAISAVLSAGLGIALGAATKFLCRENTPTNGLSFIQGYVFSHCTLADPHGYVINMAMAETGYDYGVALAEYALRIS